MRVLNKAKHGIPENSVYIGRPSKWGNPFIVGEDGTRAEVISKYAHYLSQNTELLSRLMELEGKDLVCWCSPLPCHGDVIISMIKQMKREQFIER